MTDLELEILKRDLQDVENTLDIGDIKKDSIEYLTLIEKLYSLVATINQEVQRRKALE